MAFAKAVSRGTINEKAEELINVIKKLIELEKYFNSKVTSRTTLSELLNGNSEEAKQYRELRKQYIELYDFLGKYDPKLLKKIIKEYEENADHMRFVITLKREKRLKDNEIEKIEDRLKEYRDQMDDYIKEQAEGR